jgi:hypothetical protein
MNSKYKNIEALEVIARCGAGAAIGDCVRDAIVMAFEEMRTVKFKHNEREYVVNPKDLADTIYKQHA